VVRNEAAGWRVKQRKWLPLLAPGSSTVIINEVGFSITSIFGVNTFAKGVEPVGGQVVRGQFLCEVGGVP
jgi:hypothetical protein